MPFQVDRQCKEKRAQNEQINILTSQLILFESRLVKKQKQISMLLEQREQTILRQQKFINMLCNLLTENGVDIPECPEAFKIGFVTCDRNGGGATAGSGNGVVIGNGGGGSVVLNFLDSLNDSDSAVVLDDIDSDCNSNSITIIRPSKGHGDVTVCRSISDAIETNLLLNKYASGRRSNCFLKRPDILETVYSVEEDSEPNVNSQQQQQQQQLSPTKSVGGGGGGSMSGTRIFSRDGELKSPLGGQNVMERRDKFKNRTEKVIASERDELHDDGNFMTITDDEGSGGGGKGLARLTQHEINKLNIEYNRRRISEEFLNSGHYYDAHSEINNNNHSSSHHHHNGSHPSDSSCNSQQQQQQQQPPNLVNYNRVMLNHRAIQRPKDVKYKRINKAKSKSLEELRGKLRQWIDHKANNGGSGGSGGGSSCGSTGSANGSINGDYMLASAETSSPPPVVVASQSFA